MDESSFWARTRKLVSPLGMFKRVENGLDNGTPDVWYVIRDLQFHDGMRVRTMGGWIENKYRPSVPLSKTAPFKAEGAGHKTGLRKSQIVWWTEYLAVGGHGLLCWGVGPYSFAELVTLDLLDTFNGMPWAQMRERYEGTGDSLTFGQRLTLLL